MKKQTNKRKLNPFPSYKIDDRRSQVKTKADLRTAILPNYGGWAFLAKVVLPWGNPPRPICVSTLAWPRPRLAKSCWWSRCKCRGPRLWRRRRQRRRRSSPPCPRSGHTRRGPAETRCGTVGSPAPGGRAWLSWRLLKWEACSLPAVSCSPVAARACRWQPRKKTADQNKQRRNKADEPNGQKTQQQRAVKTNIPQEWREIAMNSQRSHIATHSRVHPSFLTMLHQRWPLPSGPNTNKRPVESRDSSNKSLPFSAAARAIHPSSAMSDRRRSAVAGSRGWKRTWCG